MELVSSYLENGTAFLLVIATLVLFSVISLVLFLFKIFQILQQKKMLNMPQNIANPEEEDVGIVINSSSIRYKGKKLKYFILKDNTHESERLAVGTKVKVLKKTASEAYVQPILAN